MAKKSLAADHYPGLVRPHPPLPGAPPPQPGMHLLDLLSEPDEAPAARAAAAAAPIERGDPLPMVLAAVAAVLAIAAVGVSIMTWLSMSSLAGVAAAGGQPTVAVAASPTASEEVAAGAEQPLGAAPDDYSSPADLRTATYGVAYSTQSLQLALPPCNSQLVRYVDIDEPRVDADASRADFFYTSRTGCDGTPQINLIGAVTASVVARSSLRPSQCVDSIRNAPATSPIQLTKGLNLCVLTSSDSAIGQNISQKVAMLAISPPDTSGSVTVRITGWNIVP